VSEFKRVPNVGLRPSAEIVGEERVEWVYVRLIQKPEGQFVSVEATEAILLDEGIGVVPGACVARSRAELDAFIAALGRMRDRLPE
jgi:hypothetical protein